MSDVGQVDRMMAHQLASYDASYPPSILTPPVPPVVHSTGATAGTPGAWTPPGSTPPATVAALIAGTPNAVVANPATVWTTGQRVVCGDAATAHWSGAAWVAGVAAAEEPEAPPEVAE